MGSEGASPSRRDSLLTGLAAGVLNGLIGIGGGIVMVPLLRRQGLPLPSVIGTSLAGVVCLSACAFLVHVSAAGYALSFAGSVTVILSGAVGAQAGGWLLTRVPERWVMLAFASLVFLAATRLVATGLGLAAIPEVGGAEPPLWAFASLGTVSGLVAGLIGVGGGALVVLGLALFFGVTVQGALPLALAINVTNGLSGCWVQARAGRVAWSTVRRMVPAALVGIALGAALALVLPPNPMRVVFGAFFLFMSARVGTRALRQGPR